MRVAKSGFQINIPEFLYDELSKKIQESGRTATTLSVANEVQRAILVYVAGVENKESNDFKELNEILKTSLFGITDLIAKTLLLTINNDVKGTKYELSLEEINQKAHSISNEILKDLMNTSDREKSSIRMKAYYNRNRPRLYSNETE